MSKINNDETKINLYLSMQKQKYGQKKGTANDPKHIASSVKHGGGGVMALGMHGCLWNRLSQLYQ